MSNLGRWHFVEALRYQLLSATSVPPMHRTAKLLFRLGRLNGAAACFARLGFSSYSYWFAFFFLMSSGLSLANEVEPSYGAVDVSNFSLPCMVGRSSSHPQSYTYAILRSSPIAATADPILFRP